MNKIILVELVRYEGYGESIICRKAFASEEKAEAYRNSLEIGSWDYIRTEILEVE